MRFQKWVFHMQLTRRCCASDFKSQDKNRKPYIGRGPLRSRLKSFCLWKKQAKDGKQVPQKLPGVLTPKKNDNSITSDSGPCPSLTEHEYKPRYFDEPEWLSSD